jgi:pyruvate formate lyase activating enzyme
MGTIRFWDEEDLYNFHILGSYMKCRVCNRNIELIARVFGICASCIKSNFNSCKSVIEHAHYESRIDFKLPEAPPTCRDGVQCKLCVNECKIAIGTRGYCGLRENRDGNLYNLGGVPMRGVVEWYYDPLPTNCVAIESCPGGTGAGYPKYSYSKHGPEYGYKNLAVFYGACTFNCLFCQNWHYRYAAYKLKPMMTAEQLAAKVDAKTSCICYFGGDPTPQLMHALKTSRLALARIRNEMGDAAILRICWETNGSMARNMLEKMATISMDTGGCIKFDLKSWNENLHVALCGVTNKRTLDNFKYLAVLGKSRPEPPFVVASTLLVPGYVGYDEVRQIAEFIAELDPSIPYSLLAFHPQFYMRDLPITPRDWAYECFDAAKSVGLERVRIGNLHLLL